MKKIMFNDRYGLTHAVLDGRKTMTRRIAVYGNITYVGITNGGYEFRIGDNYQTEIIYPKFSIGEVVAVAQPYKDIEQYKNVLVCPAAAGWANKMFVRADLMPHQIQITDIKVERLQDISAEDCIKEGIVQLTFDTYSFDNWKFFTRDAREAFAALIDRVSGKGTWNANPNVFAYSFKLIK